MAVLRFEPSIRYIHNEQVYIVRQLLVEGRLLVENLSFGGQITVARDDLVTAWAAGELRFEVIGANVEQPKDRPIATNYTFADFQQLPMVQRDEAWRRYELILPLLKLSPRERTRQYIEAYVAMLRSSRTEVSVESPSKHRGVMGEALSRASLQRWLEAFVTSRFDIRSLVPSTYRCGNKGQHRLDAACEQIIESVLAACDAAPSTRTANDIYLMVVNRTAEANRFRAPEDRMEPPGAMTIYRRIRTLGGSVLRRRASRLEKQADASVEVGPRPTRPLERVEIDHTKLDLFVVDVEDRMPIGRPTVTVALDVATKMPLGIYVGFEPPSYLTVMQCLQHAILPKGDTRQLYETENLWPCYGLFENLVVDNGREFIGRDLEDACGQLGITLVRMPPKTPWFKPSIERFFSTNNSGLNHTLPGTTFSNIIERGDYDVFQHACISLTAFRQLLHIFFLDIYAQRWHNGLVGIPAKRWNEGVQAGFVPSIPHSAEDVRILLGRTTERTLGRSGIEFESMYYNSPDLQRVRSALPKSNRQVRIKYDPSNLGNIYVYDPTAKGGAWIHVSERDDPSYSEGLSLWKHKVVRSYVLAEQKQVDIVALAAAKQHIQEIVAREFALTRKGKGRMTSARFLGITSETLESAITPKSAKLLVSESAEPQKESSPTANTSSEPATSSHTDASKSRKRKSSTDQTSVDNSSPMAADLDDLDEAGWGADYVLP